MAAATATANSNPNCAETVLGSFYWEIGDKDGKQVSGAVGTLIGASTTMNIASASKWLYSSYVLQKVGVVRTQDVPFLNFTSGYSNFGAPLCQGDSVTVGSCLSGHDNFVPTSEGKFDYDSGHMQHHAAIIMKGLVDKNNVALTTELRDTTGVSGFTYAQVLLAGGLVASANDYSGFLRRILNNQLVMASALGTNPVCTNPATCDKAVHSPIPNEDWHYSLGHWVEDAHGIGDGAFSSAGAFGFYPWLDSTKTHYGILARLSPVAELNAGYHSAQCGRLIRQAYRTGVAVTTATTPTP